MSALGGAHWRGNFVEPQNLMAFYRLYIQHSISFIGLWLQSITQLQHSLLCCGVALCETGQSPLVSSGFLCSEWPLFSCFTRWQDNVQNGEGGRLRSSHPSSLYKEPLQKKPDYWGTNFCFLGLSLDFIQVKVGL